MAYTPISNSVLQYSKNAGGASASDYYLKLYAASTTTPINMYSLADGTGALTKCQFDSLGFPINGSGGRFIPYIDQDYRIVLYTNSTDADANTFASAAFDVDDVPQGASQSDLSFVKPFATLALATADTGIVAGNAINLAERTTGNGGGGMWDVIAGTGTANGMDLVAHDTLSLTFVLRINPKFNEVDQYGANGDDDGTGTVGTDDSAIIQRAIVAAGVGGYTVLDGSKSYRIDTGIYIPARSTLDCNWARIAYTGTGTGQGQTTSWAGGVATGPVAGITLGEETGALQYTCRFINFKLNIKDIGATGLCFYGTCNSYAVGLIEGLYQPFDNTRTNIGYLVRGSAVGSNFGNTFDILCNHLHENCRVENYGTSNTQPTGNLWLNGSVNGDYATDTTSIGINFADSTVATQGQGSKILGTNIEACTTGIYFGALNDGIDVNARFEISSGVSASRTLKYHATATNITVRGSGLNPALIGAVGGGIEGFAGGTNHIYGSEGSEREAGNASSWSGLTAPIRATNVATHIYKDNAQTWHRTMDDSNGAGEFLYQPGSGVSNEGGFLRLSGHTHATRPKETQIGPSAGGALNVLNGIGGTTLARIDSQIAAGQTSLWLYDADNATLERVTVGAADSGGAGFKVLRIPN